LSVLAKPAALETALAVLLLQPSPPLLFMGEEWGATEPFPFFCNFTGDLAEAVRQGRKREFAEAYARHGDEIPDPLSADTRASAVLDWDALAKPEHAERLKLTRALLVARRRWIVPLIPAMTGENTATVSDGILHAAWPAGAARLSLLANLSDTPTPCPPLAWGEPIWGDAPPRDLAPWSVYAAIGGA
jgi:1,4-alpha-glucan branching enzyme